jgi:hypothetical protein
MRTPANPHFVTASTWAEARDLLSFSPAVPSETAGRSLASLRIHIRDHRLRDVPVGARTLEAHYGSFVLSEASPGTSEARRLALEVSYGREPHAARIAGREARMYELGPPVPADDIDGRSPAVVAWHDGDRFYLIASTELPAATLVGIASSLYP